MPTPSRLNEIAQNLETDPNITRIKKVLLCAYSGKWENDSHVLDSINLNVLLQNIYQKHPQFEPLKIILNNILSRLNKKNEYNLVLERIEAQISQFYIQSDVEEIPELNQLSITASETIKISPEELNSLSSAYFSQGVPAHQIRNISNLFDVRFKIMQHTNPLRAKLVIFSSLEREFNYREEDWSQLKNQSLDDLLHELLQTFPNVDRLKSHLYKMAEYLEDTDENIQAVTVILDALNPYYETKAKSRSDSGLNHPPGNTTPPRSSILQQHFLTDNAIDINESETVHLLSPNPPNLGLGLPKTQHFTTISESSFSDFTSATAFSNIDIPPTDSGEMSDDLRKKLILEQEVEQIVGNSVADTLVPLTTILKHLELALNQQLKNHPPEIQLEIKYKSLRRFIHVLQAKVGDLAGVIHQSEVEEQQRLSQHKTTIAVEEEDPEQLEPRLTHGQLLELAKQGHAKAIATVISQSLKPKGINTLTKSKEGCLHIILESDQVPNQASMSQFIRQKLLDLNIQLIQKVKVYARTPGSKSMAWVQEFTYTGTQR
ncbi:hypothetical protein PA905_25510 [Planktothrix agardhii CCAP 1459/11A]|jgi:hypothetical protein|uniref:Uncharacterized protein n=1 Tax=Planktothrix agardhii CCAP 1459/11A TaxID=282420 RepID=A0A4P5ZX02_PLAAG|nr:MULTISPECIES: hypothetical protein [Planktothrix]GDZ94595.1 hypothetical protein PA905_25510 [Planktothrix agardhii CCAP 1459/11A]CAH2570686.1 hypothetical protein PRNO82_00074 [Planktothrix rubescens]